MFSFSIKKVLIWTPYKVSLFILQMQKKILREQVRPPDSHYNVNITLSDMISMERDILDTRPQVKIHVSQN